MLDWLGVTFVSKAIFIIIIIIIIPALVIQRSIYIQHSVTMWLNILTISMFLFQRINANYTSLERAFRAFTSGIQQ